MELTEEDIQMLYAYKNGEASGDGLRKQNTEMVWAAVRGEACWKKHYVDAAYSGLRKPLENSIRKNLSAGNYFYIEYSITHII